MRWAFSVGLLLVGCRKPVAATESFTSAVDPDAPGLESVEARPVSSGQWTSGEWSMFVPPGWSGTEGPPPRLLTIQSDVDDHQLMVTRGDLPADPSCTFDSRGTYRGPARLVVRRSRTCIADGRVAMDWLTHTRGELVWVRVSFVEGRVFAGRQAVTPLLDSLDRR